MGGRWHLGRLALLLQVVDAAPDLELLVVVDGEHGDELLVLQGGVGPDDLAAGELYLLLAHPHPVLPGGARQGRDPPEARLDVPLLDGPGVGAAQADVEGPLREEDGELPGGLGGVEALLLGEEDILMLLHRVRVMVDREPGQQELGVRLVEQHGHHLQVVQG